MRTQSSDRLVVSTKPSSETDIEQLSLPMEISPLRGQRPLLRMLGWCGRRLCVPHPGQVTRLNLDPMITSRTMRRNRVRQKPQVTSQRATT